MRRFNVFIMMTVISVPLFAQMKYYVSTDSLVYHYGDSIHIAITAVNTGNIDDTLWLSGCDVNYHVDNFNLLGHRPCPLVIIPIVISAHDSIRWSGSPQLPPYPVNKDTLPAGVHSVVGEIINQWKSDPLWVTVSSIDAVKRDVVPPVDYLLQDNYPDPFNPSTIIGYRLPINSRVTLRIYDVLGREVATLVNKVQNAGRYTVVFDATSLPSGVYFDRFQAGTFTDTKKILLLK